jgi:hypothetical protein
LLITAGGQRCQSSLLAFREELQDECPNAQPHVFEGQHERYICLGSRRERLALEQAKRRVRSCALRRKWRGAGRHGITRGSKVREVIAVIISILLCSSGKGSGSIMASRRDSSEVEMRFQRRF